MDLIWERKTIWRTLNGSQMQLIWQIFTNGSPKPLFPGPCICCKSPLLLIIVLGSLLLLALLGFCCLMFIWFNMKAACACTCPRTNAACAIKAACITCGRKEILWHQYECNMLILIKNQSIEQHRKSDSFQFRYWIQDEPCFNSESITKYKITWDRKLILRKLFKNG